MDESEKPERHGATEQAGATMALAKRGAENLVRNHLRVAPGERVVVFHLGAGEVRPPILAALAAVGASTEEVDLAPTQALEERDVVQLLRDRVRGATASLFLGASSGISYPWARLLVDTLDQTGVRHLHAPGISLRMLGTSLRADPALLERVNERVRERLSTGKVLTVKSPAGTDLRVALGAEYPIVAYDGIPKVGAWNSVPTGSVNWYAASVEGTYVADRIARGTHLGQTRDAARTPVRLQVTASTLTGHECADAAFAQEVDDHFGRHGNARRLGFVALSTNYVARAEIRVFAHDVILPGLRLQFGYSDQRKTHAPRTSPIWATFLGRRQTVVIDGEIVVRDGRVESRWVEGIVPF